MMQRSCSDSHCVFVQNGLLLSEPVSKQANRFGQLGRELTKNPADVITLPHGQVASCVAAGGDKSSGHSAVGTTTGDLLTFGCDRWLQLGLGASSGGASGYTWSDGKLWQRDPQLVSALHSILPGKSKCNVVDVSCGSEHTAALCISGHVITWGRGNKGKCDKIRGWAYCM